MPLYYYDKSLETVEKEKKEKRYTQAEYLKRQRAAASKKTKIKTPVSSRTPLTAAERKRRQSVETARFEKDNPEHVGRKYIPSKTGVGEKVSIKNPTIAGKKTAKPTAKPTARRSGNTGKREKIPTPEGSYRKRGNKFKKISGKKGKTGAKGQKKVAEANARNAGRSIMGTQGSSNTDPYSTQARGAQARFRAQGGKFKKPTETIKSLDHLQGQLQGMLLIIKTVDTSLGAFRSLKNPEKYQQDKKQKKRSLRRQKPEGADNAVSTGMGYISNIKQSLDNQMKTLLKFYKT
jgi:hypothetical protein